MMGRFYKTVKFLTIFCGHLIHMYVKINIKVHIKNVSGQKRVCKTVLMAVISGSYWSVRHFSKEI